MKKKKTYLDAGVLIAAVRGKDEVATRAMQVLDDSDREFVSSAYKLQLPHPPGAPLFILLGRFFIILFGDHPDSAAARYIRSHTATGRKSRSAFLLPRG